MKKTLLFLGIVFGMLTVSAEENVLQSIEIVPVKDTYNIVLVADKAVDVKKTVQAPNKITLDMKGIRASKNLSTIYNNVSNVDTVMVEPAGNGISLFFQAENAQASSISFDSLAPVVPAKQTKNIKLNSPIESYAPIYREDLSKEKTSSFFNKITKKNSMINDTIEENLDSTAVTDILNKVFSFGLIGLLAFAVIRLFKRKEPDMKIGLSQSINSREIEMYKGEKNIQPLGTNYMNAEKPFTTYSYGINAYQREMENPYESQQMTIHNPRLRNNNFNMDTPVSQPIQPVQLQRFSAQPVRTSAVTMQNVQTAQAPVKNTSAAQPVSNPNIDNLKFLESMTAIYEKSGRHDLAQGLKASLNKSNLG